MVIVDYENGKTKIIFNIYTRYKGTRHKFIRDMLKFEHLQFACDKNVMTYIENFA